MSALRKLARRLRRATARTRPQVWVPAPQPVISLRDAGIDVAELSMPTAFERFLAPPVFICGSARSGTTWTFDLFNAHPDVHALCETWVLSQTHGVTSILTQSYWATRTREAWEERVDVPFGAVQLMTYAEAIRDLGNMVADWLTRHARPEHKYLAAKEPLDVAAAAILFPSARFIHVTRDGRDVVLSMRHASETWDPSMGVEVPIEFRAEVWRRQVESVREHRLALGGRYMEIKYEDMVGDVANGIRSLFTFAEIPFDDTLIQSIRNATDLSAVSAVAESSGFRGGSHRAGRKSLTRREEAAFRRIAGKLLTELGY